MTPAEISAASRLSGRAFAGLVSRIEQMHQAIAGRAFAPAGPASAPARVIHDSITRGVYLAVRGAERPERGNRGRQVRSLCSKHSRNHTESPAECDQDRAAIFMIETSVLHLKKVKTQND